MARGSQIVRVWASMPAVALLATSVRLLRGCDQLRVQSPELIRRSLMIAPVPTMTKTRSSAAATGELFATQCTDMSAKASIEPLPTIEFVA
ncbi:uncharacterized protein [Miscanthus floridulus]|uniref:uncharacterized protein isoform X2 n=1 Tax=Miscanthus floridulus TaxID=154761 RepID=UPI0034580035